MSLAVRKNPIDLPAGLALALNLGRLTTPMLVLTGEAQLGAGLLAVTGQPGIQANSIIVGSILTPGGTQGTTYKWIPTATGGGFTVTAISTAGATITTDTSLLQWIAFTPCYHADVTSTTNGDSRDLKYSALTVTATNASDLPTSLVLAANIDAVLRAHLGDALGASDVKCGAHIEADTTDVPATAVPVDLTTLEAYLNDVKSKFNTHIASTSYHYAADTTNTITAANASSQGTANTLANAIKTALNAHAAIAPLGAGVRVLD